MTAGPDGHAAAWRDTAARCRAVAVAAGLAVDDAVSAATRTVGCVEWDGPAADVHVGAATRLGRRSGDLASAVRRVANALDDVADSASRTSALLAEVGAEEAALAGDPVATWTLAARRESVVAEHRAVERAAAAAVAAAASALPVDWGERRILGLTGQQWRDGLRGAGEAAWGAGPETVTFLLRWGSVQGFLGLYDQVDRWENDARSWLVEWGGGQDTGGAYWTAYGAGTVGAMLLPGPAGKTAAVDDAARLTARGGALGHADDVARLPAASHGAGPWAGPDGLRLTSAQNRQVVEFHDRAAEAERSLTPRLLEISERSGVALAGLEHRLKSLESTQRKVADEVAEQGGGADAAPVLARVNDAVRFTFTSSDATYVSDVTDVVRRLEGAGFERVRWRLSWPDDGYQGLNTSWRDPVTGQLLEVQFHTPGSFFMKEFTHPLYEERRLPGITAERLLEVDAEDRWLHGQVTRPPGVERLVTPPTS
ncbi:MAG: hypothetical protein ACFCVG_17845 [Kineosporiaceae bacterium]